jgi:hypothetical protein
VKKKHHLHELIHSLTAPEKRYFKRITAAWKENENDYLLLYHHIHEMPVYNEQALRSNLGPKPFLKNLDVKKHYLYELILDSLQQFHNKRMEKENAIVRVTLLIEKNLFEQAAILLNQGLKDARERNDYIYELRLLQHLTLLDSVNRGAEKTETIKLIREAIQNYENLNSYELIFQKLQDVYLGYFFVRNTKQFEKLEQVTMHANLESVNKAKNLLSRLYFYRTWFVFYSSTGQWQLSYEIANKGYACIKSHKLARTYFARTYLMAINNVLASSLMSDKTAELNTTLKQLERDMRQFQGENLKFQAKTRLLQYRFLAVLKEGNAGKIKDYLPEVVSFIEKHDNDIEKYKLKILYFDVAKAYPHPTKILVLPMFMLFQEFFICLVWLKPVN